MIVNDNWKYPTRIKHISLKVNEQRTIEVLAKEYYSSGVLVVEKGQQYKIKVAQGDFWKDAFIRCSAKGFRNILLRKSKRRVKEVVCFHLCGTIGMNDMHNFPIGLGCDYSVPHSGNLHFFANDKKDSRFANRNNKGFLNVVLRRIE